MQEFDIPIFQKTYALYKTLYGFRTHVPKQDRYTLWQRCEGLTLDVLEHILLASQRSRTAKESALETASVKLNLLRIFVRLAKDVRAIDAKKYVTLEALIDEIGRMLGGWIRASKSPP